MTKEQIKTFTSGQHKQNFNPSKDDLTLIRQLSEKLGLSFANLVRMGLRLLAEKELS